MQITQTELNMLKKYISGRISYAKYYSGGEGYRIDVNKITVLSDGRIAIYILFPSGIQNQIDRIEFYTANNEIFASGAETLNTAAAGDDVLYRYTITITQANE